VRRIVVVLLVCLLPASLLFGSLPLVRADYTFNHASFPPDLRETLIMMEKLT